MATINCNVDDSVKENARATYANWGIDLTTAINVFLRKSIECGGFPFSVKRSEPSILTLSALREAEMLAKDPSAKAYSSARELFEDLETDDEV